MAGTKRLVIILISAMLAAYAPVSQKGYLCDTAVVKMSVGGTDIHGTSKTDKQAEYKISIKKEGKKLTLQKNAEAEIVRLMEEELNNILMYNGVMPLDQLETYEKTGVVIEVKYPDGKELSVREKNRLVHTIMFIVNDHEALFDYDTYINGGLGGTPYDIDGKFCESIFSCLTSENIISEEPLDFTAPKTNIKNGKTYKSGKKITFSDEGSGMKSAKLDGKKDKKRPCSKEKRKA